jgi:hypothetical protein
MNIVYLFVYCSLEKAREALIYSYTRNINGFAAILEEKEVVDIQSIQRLCC